MVSSISDQQIEQEINEWMSILADKYEDDFIIILDSVSNDKIQFTIEDVLLKIHLNDGIACELTTKTHNDKILDYISTCNERLFCMEFPVLGKALTFIFDKYQQMKKHGQARTTPAKSQDMSMEPQYDDGHVHQVQADEDVEMDEGDDEENDAWNVLEEGESDDIDYTKIVQDQAHEEQREKQIRFGKIGGQADFSEVMNLKSVKVFEKTKFYEEALDAQEYLNKNDHVIKGWMNIAVVKEFLTIRLEIDLNYVDLAPINIAMFGWNIEEPLIISFSAKESKLLNYIEEKESRAQGFKEMWESGMLDFSCSNAGKEESYGCKDYIRTLFKKFVETLLRKGSPYKQHKHEEEKGGSHIGKEQPKLGLFKKFFSSKVDDEALATLVEMGFEVEVAKKALKKTGNDINKALDNLRDEFLSGALNEGEAVDGVGSAFMTSSKFLPETNSRLIQLMLFVCDNIEMATRTCFICLEPLTGDSFKLRTCHQDYCEYTFEESFGGQVYPQLKYSPNECHLDLSIASKALFSTRATAVLEPFPTFFLKHFELRTKRGYLDEIHKVKTLGKGIEQAKKIDEKNKDLESMIKIFQKMPTPQEFLGRTTDDESLRAYLLELYGNNIQDSLKAYKLLAYIFATNRSTIRELNETEKVDVTPKDYFKQFILTNIDPDKERIFVQRKKAKGSFFAWHGSSLENWYSIMRNGLRNLSNSHMMTAGAAYGQGIYASSNFNTSLGYSSRHSIQAKFWSKACFSNYFIIGIVEIINVPEYKKDPGCNICVVPDENDIILRYLFLYNNASHAQSELNTLKIDFENHYYSYVRALNKEKRVERQNIIEKAYKKYLERKNKEMEQKAKIEQEMLKREENELLKVQDAQLQKMKSKIQGKGSAMATERIMVEYKGMRNSADFKKIIAIDFVKDNMYTWQVVFDITKYEISKELKEDFQQWAKTYNSQEQIEYEVMFSDSYPFSPPFIRVVKPRFMYQTGHITVGGSICMESLTPTGWSSARSLESYFIEILSLLNIGGARLDLRTNQPYTLYEAKEAFSRVAKQHGWLK